MTASSLPTEFHWNKLLLRLLLPVLLVFSVPLKAAPEKQLAVDSSDVQLNQPSKGTQEDYYNDEYWSFDRNKQDLAKQEPNVFDRMWKRFLESIEHSLMSGSSGSGSNFWGIFWIVILVVLVVWAILKVTNSGTNSLFSGRRKKSEDIDATLEDVDIHAIDYERMIAEALANRDYRLGVRLWFLRTLKTLSDKELLTWKIDKTNSDYFYDLSGSDLQDGFGKVSFVYDYIWYGDFPVNEMSYREAEDKFKNFQKTIDAKT